MPTLQLIHGEKNYNTPPTLLGSTFLLRTDILWPVYSAKVSRITWLAAGTKIKIQYISDLFIYLDIVHSYDSIAHVTVDVFRESLNQNKVVEFCASRYMVCLQGEKPQEESEGVRTIRRNMRANAARRKQMAEKMAKMRIIK